MKNIVVSGIGTGVGKTIVSAILVEALQADYWKPVQSGDLANSDTHTVRDLVSSTTTFHPETYRLEHPLSPHHSARLSGIAIDSARFVLPQTARPLIIEMAGGLLVPLNQTTLLVDVISQWECSWVVVCKLMLGCINHTLLTIEALRSRKQPILGIIFNGPSIPDTENFILNYTGVPCLGRLQQEPVLDKAIIRRYANEWLHNVQQIAGAAR